MFNWKSLAVFTMALLGLSFHSSGSKEQAAHIASPEYYQVLLENDQVIVLTMVLKPGQQDLLHSHNNETVYFQSGGKLKITEAGGQSFEVEVPDGHVMWHEAWAHQVENVGNSKVVAIIVETKSVSVKL